MKLSDYAIKHGVCYQTAYNWFKAGKIPNARQMDTSTILVDDFLNNNKIENICIYARVSSNDRKDCLNTQIQKITEFANAKGISINKSYKEVASGMNDKRRELTKMLNSDPTIILIENKDRLTRFGFNYLELLLNKQGCKIIVMNQSQDDQHDLMKDLVSIITSFCCRLYGLRRTKNKVNKLKEIVNDNN